MSDRLGTALANALGGSKTVTRTQRTSSRIPDPPVLSPIVRAAQSVGSAVQRAPVTSSLIPEPPVLSLSAALSRNIQREVAPGPIYTLGTGSGVTRTSRAAGVTREKSDLAGVVAMPEAVSLAQRVKNASKAIQSPQQVKQQEIDVSTALTQSMSSAATVMSPEWQEQNRIIIYRDKSTGTTRLAARENFEADPDKFEIIGRASVDEGKSILAALGINDDGSIKTPSAGLVDSTQAEAGRSQQETDIALDNQRRRKAAEAADVTEIDGKLYPTGTTKPISMNSITRGNSALTAEKMPPAPDGYVWVGDNSGYVWLEVDQRDSAGRQILPASVVAIKREDQLGQDPVSQAIGAITPGDVSLLDPAAELFETAIEGTVNGVLNVTPKLIPKVVKDWWDANVQEPFELALSVYNSSPEVRDAIDTAVPGTPSAVLTIPEIQQLISAAVDNPLSAVLVAVQLPQQKLIDVTVGHKIKEYRGEASGVPVFTAVVANIPFVDQFFTWMDANPEVATGLYDNGYDADGDDVIDATGSMAVWMYWEDKEAGGFVRVMANVLSDPLTYAAGAGVAGRGVSRAGRTIRMAPEAGAVRRTLGSTVDVTGRVISGAARVTEDVADLGARYVLNGVGGIMRRVNTPVSTAREAAHMADVGEAVYANANQRGNGLQTLGTLQQIDETGRLQMVLNEENAPTTGPAARKPRDTQTVTEADLGQMIDEVQGESGPVEVIEPDGTSSVYNSTAGAENALASTPSETGDVPTRWLRRDIEPGKPVRYTDGLRQEDWNQVLPPLADDLNASANKLSEYNLPGDKETTTPQHLKESIRISQVVMDRTRQVDPTYTRQWEPLVGNRADYMLSEAFGRTDWKTAHSLWDAMTGGPSEVPLITGYVFRANKSKPLFSLERVAKNIDDPNHPKVRRANNTVDAVYQRLLQYPDALNDAAFARIVERAADLDFDLRKRGLRDIDPVYDWPPITTLIPEGSAVRLRPEVRAMSEANVPPVVSDAATAGWYQDTIAISPDGSITADLYLVESGNVPQVWLDKYPDADLMLWSRAETLLPDEVRIETYGPMEADAIRAAQETAAARGFDMGDGVTPHDHVADVEGQPAPGTAERATPESLPAPEPSVAPEGTQRAERADLLSQEEVRIEQRQTKHTAAMAGDTGVREVPTAPVRTVKDPTGTIDVPQVPDPVQTPPLDLDASLPPMDDATVTSNSARLKKQYAARTGKAAESTGDARWLGRTIEPWEVDVLTQHRFANGETLMDRVTRYFVEAGDSGNWKAWPDDYFDAAMKKVWPEYEALMVEVYPRGVLPNWTKAAIEKLPQPIQKALAAANTVLRKLILEPFDKYSQWRRERILFSRFKVLHYPMTQYLGNIMLSFMYGDPVTAIRMLNPRNNFRIVQALKKADPELWWRETGIPTSSQEMFTKLGMVRSSEVTDVFTGRGIGDVSTSRVKKVLNSPLAKELGAAGDVSYRDAVETSVFTRGMKELYPDYRNMQINRMMDWLDIDRAEATTLWREFEARHKGWEYSYNDVVNHFRPILGNGDVTLGRGRAERMGRDWRQTLNKNQSATRKELRFRTMAQPETKLDLIARRALAFPFFQVRQMWFMYNQMARHPFLINLYINAQESLEQASEDWPDYMRGWVRVMGLPLSGRHLFLNPVALLSTYTLFEQQDFFSDREEEPESRPAFRKWFEDWFGFDPYSTEIMGVRPVSLLSPVLSDTLNVTGQSGDIWAPDLLGIGREASLLTLVVNTGRAYGLIGDDPTPIGNIYNDWNSRLRETISSIVPDTDTVEYRSSEKTMDREIRAIMVDEAEKAGLDLTDPDDYAIFVEAQMDPNSDLYQRSLKRWILGEWEEQAAKIVVGPLRPRTRIENNLGGDLMADLTDAERRIVNTPEPTVELFRRQSAAYHEIGTPLDRRRADLYEEIVYGQVIGDITVNGKTYTEDEVNAMDVEQRKALANGLMAEYGSLEPLNKFRDERAKFLAQPENAEYAQYQNWSGAVRDYDGGPEQYWKDLTRDNPSAKAYYDEVIAKETDLAARSRLMTGQNAYFAVLGWDTYVYQKPVEGYNSRAEVWDPLGILNLEPQAKPYEENNAEFKNEVRQAPVFLAEMEAYDNAYRQKMVERGYNPDTPVNKLPTKQRIAIEEELDAEGVYEPKPSWQVEQFLEWLEQQPAGRYRTVDDAMAAFFESEQDEYYQNLPAKTEGKVNTPKPVAGPDKYGNTPTGNYGSTDDFWTNMANLLNQHDHNRYKDPWQLP